MVIGERFVWVHIPKTGGDSTRKQMTYVYESNPSWAMLEKQIYGNTLLDEL